MHVECLINYKIVSLIAFWTSGTMAKEQADVKGFSLYFRRLRKSCGRIGDSHDGGHVEDERATGAASVQITIVL